MLRCQKFIYTHNIKGKRIILRDLITKLDQIKLIVLNKIAVKTELGHSTLPYLKLAVVLHLMIMLEQYLCQILMNRLKEIVNMLVGETDF